MISKPSKPEKRIGRRPLPPTLKRKPLNITLPPQQVDELMKMGLVASRVVEFAIDQLLQSAKEDRSMMATLRAKCQ